MMKINCATVLFRELLWEDIADAEEAHNVTLDVSVYDDIADEFAGDVLNALSRQAVNWERCYTVAVQSATHDERDLFYATVDAARPKAAERLLEFCKVMAQIQIDSSGQGHCRFCGK